MAFELRPDGEKEPGLEDIPGIWGSLYGGPEAQTHLSSLRTYQRPVLMRKRHRFSRAAGAWKGV